MDDSAEVSSEENANQATEKNIGGYRDECLASERNSATEEKKIERTTGARGFPLYNKSHQT